MKRFTMVWLLIVASGVPLLCAAAAAAEPQTSGREAELQGLDVEVIPGDKVTDPFLGDWQGQWAAGWPRNLVAQVIPRGSGSYQINFLPALDQRCPTYASIESKSDDAVLRFDQRG